MTPTLRDYPKLLAPIYQTICAMNPAARQVVIDGTRRMAPLDTPEEFNRVIGAFLSELRPPAAEIRPPAQTPGDAGHG